MEDNRIVIDLEFSEDNSKLSSSGKKQKNLSSSINRSSLVKKN